MEKNNRPETEEERRERMRRLRARKEMQKQRMRRKKIIRMSVYILVAVLGVLMIFAVIVIVNRVRDERAEQAVQEARQEEITNSEFYDPSQVIHLSFPVLTLDGAGSGLSVSQFRLILDDLYKNGYILVDPYDLTERSEKGFASAQIMVPAGKRPMILSQFDVSYEDGDTAHAAALTKDASGRISCSYYNEYGTLITGAEDVVPIVEEFIEDHPDFSYRGARGILGVTGYRGALGYQVEEEEVPVQTIPIEEPGEDEESGELDGYDESGYDDGYGEASAGLLFIEEEKNKAVFLADEDSSGQDGETVPEDRPENDHPEENKIEETINRNRETVKDLMGTLRSGGWHIASNSYGLVSYAGSEGLVQEDAEHWNSVIGPLAGTTDMIMLPEAADIGKWSGYSDNEPRYMLLKEMGFRYFFVGNEEARTWAQVKPAYVRQGMHEIREYAAYLALMNEGENTPVQADTAAEETAEELTEDETAEEMTPDETAEEWTADGTADETAEEWTTDETTEEPAEAEPEEEWIQEENSGEPAEQEQTSGPRQLVGGVLQPAGVQ